MVGQERAVEDGQKKKATNSSRDEGGAKHSRKCFEKRGGRHRRMGGKRWRFIKFEEGGGKDDGMDIKQQGGKYRLRELRKKGNADARDDLIDMDEKNSLLKAGELRNHTAIRERRSLAM